MKKAMLETPSIQSLDRGLSILEAVAKSDEPVPLRNLTDLLGIDRSSVFRLANTLKRRGFLSYPDGRKDYVVGPSVWHLLRKHDWRMLTALCSEHLKRLAAETGETAHLAVREGRRALFIGHEASRDQLVAVSGQTGAFVPLHCTAHGKALLADCGIPELEAIFGAESLVRFTPRTITSIDRLAIECAEIKARGFVIDDGEHTPEVNCVAAPIRDKGGTVIASIGISAPAARCSKERAIVYARQVADAASRSGQCLG
jgi:DNA-binding IclR family transcriptional regulator